MLRNDRFADLKEKELEKVKLMSKTREKLTTFILIKFNEEIIIKNDQDLYLNQSKQFNHLRLIIISKSVDLIE
jgi:hypothetical protein